MGTPPPSPPPKLNAITLKYRIVCNRPTWKKIFYCVKLEFQLAGLAQKLMRPLLSPVADIDGGITTLI